MTDDRLFGRWLGATLLGWLLGFVLVVALALVAEAVGIGGAQVMVGLGMGLGVGLVQARVVKRTLALDGPWALASAIGLGVPFLLSDLRPLLGLDFLYVMPALVGVGGLLIGAWQASILRPRCARAIWWAPISAVAWTAAAAMPELASARSLHGWFGLFAFIALMLGGGAVLGMITGAALTRLSR